MTNIALKSNAADPVFTGNLEITNASSDCIISLERSGHTTHYLKSHSDDYFGIGVDGGANNGLKAKFHDNKDVEFFGNLDLKNSSSDCIITMERDGYSKHYIKSHSDGYVGIGKDGNPNNGLKAKFLDNSNVEFYGTLSVTGGVGFNSVTPVSQHSTNGLQAGASQNSGPAVLLGSAFSGNTGSTSYTVSDLVKCLKDCGLLAQ